VYAHALRLIDREGLDALSMRRLAADLGVEAASLYHHVDGKQAVLDGALALMRSEMRVSPAPSGSWKDDLEEVFLEYRRVLAAHPNMVLLAGRRTDQASESGVVYLMDRGFSLDDAVEAIQSLVAFVVGFSLFGSLDIAKGEEGLPPAIAARMADWRETTCRATVRAILDAFEGRRRPAPD
jgi:AcrR family transcriptional regulator